MTEHAIEVMGILRSLHAPWHLANLEQAADLLRVDVLSALDELVQVGKVRVLGDLYYIAAEAA